MVPSSFTHEKLNEAQILMEESAFPVLQEKPEDTGFLAQGSPIPWAPQR